MLSASERERLRVVLVTPRNPLNIGAAARAMSNFGFARLRAVNPYPLGFREARSAMGAADLLKRAEEYSTLADAVADCKLVVGTTAGRKRESRHPLRELQQGARLIRQELAAGNRTALLFGSEKRGLSNRDMSECHWLIHIPTRVDHLSMNLGQAVAVCLYELARDVRKVQAHAATAKLADAEKLERLTAALLDALTVSGYLKGRPTPARSDKVRRLVRRLSLDADDAELWMGILRQFLWAMGPKSGSQRLTGDV
jgi:TrmH family RNA methyltransferase